MRNSFVWAVFSALESVSRYNEHDLNSLIDRLFLCEDEETTLADYADIQRYIDTLEAIKAKIKPIINQIILNQSNPVEANGYKFTYRPQVRYKYEEVELWRKANESVKLNQEYQKQIEETCKKGGIVDGIEIPKVSKEVIDNFVMSKIKYNGQV